MYAPPGLAERKPELSFDEELGDEPDPYGWVQRVPEA